MKTLRELLVISGRLENRKTLLRILDELPVLVFSTATVDHAREVLATHSIELIFCEESFPDGTYKDLLKIIRLTQPETHFVLMLYTGEWSEYLEAMSLGAWEVLRSPLQPTDVEFLVNRSTRERAISCTAPAEARFLTRAASGSGAN
jgi:DNA-binding NtrC family response regulator